MKKLYVLLISLLMVCTQSIAFADWGNDFYDTEASINRGSYCDLFSNEVPGQSFNAAVSRYTAVDPATNLRQGCSYGIVMMPSTSSGIRAAEPVSYISHSSSAVVFGVKPSIGSGSTIYNRFGPVIRQCDSSSRRCRVAIDSMGNCPAGQQYEAQYCSNDMSGAPDNNQVVLDVSDYTGTDSCPIKVQENAYVTFRDFTVAVRMGTDLSKIFCDMAGVALPRNVLLSGDNATVIPGVSLSSTNNHAAIYNVRTIISTRNMGMPGTGGMGGAGGSGGMGGTGGMSGASGSGGMAGTGGMGTGGMSGAGGSGGMAGTGGMGTGGSTTSYDDLLTCDDISLASDNRTLNVEASFLPTSPNESMGAMYNANANNRIQVFTGACTSSARQDISASLTYRRDMNMMNTLHGSVTLTTPYTSGEGHYCFVAQRDDGVSCQIDYIVTSSGSGVNAPSGSFTFRSGTNVTLDWTARNGRAYLSGGHFDGSQQINGSAGMGSADDAPIVPTRYVLTVRGDDGRDYIFSNTYTPPVSADPTVDFDYVRNTAGPGFVLNWTVHNANTRTLSGPGLPEEAIAETSTRVVTQEGLYTITARGILNTLRKSLYVSSITAPGGVGPAPECLLNRIDTATGADFTWTTPNATAVTFKKDGDSGTLSTSGTQSAAISVRNPLSGFVTYTLLATGANGQSCSVTTLVMARRSVASATTPDPDGDHICNIRLTDPAPNPAVCHYFGTNQAIDNCSDIPNPDQANADGDYLGDACETSADAGVFNFPQQPAAGDGGCSCNLSTASTVTLEDQLPLVWIAASILVLRVLKKKVATS